MGSSLKGRDGFQRHVACLLDGPFVVLLEQDGADEAGDALFVREDADDFSAAFDLAIQALDGLVECSLVRCCGGKVM